MIQQQYRNKEEMSGNWHLNSAHHFITKQMKQDAKDFKTREYGDYEVRYVDTKKQPELAI